VGGFLLGRNGATDLTAPWIAVEENRYHRKEESCTLLPSLVLLSERISISFLIFYLFQIADPYPNEANLLLEFKSAETIEGCSSNFPC
jgi:hypothetical protein